MASEAPAQAKAAKKGKKAPAAAPEPAQEAAFIARRVQLFDECVKRRAAEAKGTVRALLRCLLVLQPLRHAVHLCSPSLHVCK